MHIPSEEQLSAQMAPRLSSSSFLEVSRLTQKKWQTQTACIAYNNPPIYSKSMIYPNNFESSDGLPLEILDIAQNSSSFQPI